MTDTVFKCMEGLNAKVQEQEAEIERLRKALYYEANRFQRIGTHAPDCYKWGPQHYECAMRHIKELEEDPQFAKALGPCGK